MQIGIECYNSNISEKDFRVYDVKDIGEYYAGEAYLSTCDYGKEVKIALLYNSRD